MFSYSFPCFSLGFSCFFFVVLGFSCYFLTFYLFFLWFSLCFFEGFLYLAFSLLLFFSSLFSLDFSWLFFVFCLAKNIPVLHFSWRLIRWKTFLPLPLCECFLYRIFCKSSLLSKKKEDGIVCFKNSKLHASEFQCTWTFPFLYNLMGNIFTIQLGFSVHYNFSFIFYYIILHLKQLYRIENMLSSQRWERGNREGTEEDTLFWTQKSYFPWDVPRNAIMQFHDDNRKVSN